MNKLVALLLIPSLATITLAILYLFPVFWRYNAVINYRLSVDKLIDFFYVASMKYIYGAATERWLPKRVVVIGKVDNQYIYSIVGFVVGIDSLSRTIVLQDLTGQRLRFPLEGRVLNGDVFEFTLFRMYPGLTDWRPETRISRRGDDTLRTVFCTNYPTVLIWMDGNPPDYWSDSNGIFIRQRLERVPAPTVSVHIYRDMDKTTQGCSI